MLAVHAEKVMRTLFSWLREASVALAMALCLLPSPPVAPPPSFQFFAKDRLLSFSRKRYSLWLHGPRRVLSMARIR
jgi:hypothetical protein